MSEIAVAIAVTPAAAEFLNTARIQCRGVRIRRISKSVKSSPRSSRPMCFSRIASDNIQVAKPPTSTCGACSADKSLDEIAVRVSLEPHRPL
jgi:hypothetical protein